ncbi:hypothetical protein NIES2107_05790 [Nostoc carneum NIES-2107]|nr:hypothetical protein NIES2107_05790 [Nostoc carneum NIES-2107]
MFKINNRKSLLGFALIPLAIASGSIVSENLANAQNIRQTQQTIAQSVDWVGLFWQRRPKKRLASRGVVQPVCAISPGLVETYKLWSDRPLFLWHSPGNNQDAQVVVRDYETEKVVWQKSVKIADQQATYDAEKPLEPGKFYQWQLSGSNNWTTFQVMEASDRQKIQSGLQALEQQLKSAKASPEEIALKKADFFINYEIQHTTETGTFHPWSDAFQILYQVEKPSTSFVKQRADFVSNVCKPASAARNQAK